jgi:hypothetical protein
MLPNSVKATHPRAAMLSQRRPKKAQPMTVTRMAALEEQHAESE